MRILHVTPVFYPATYWGGPVFSMLGICNALSRQNGIDLKVLTTDSSGPAGDARLDLSQRTMSFEGGRYSVEFCRKVMGADIAPSMLVRLRPLVRWADVVHLEGVYSFPTFPTLFWSRVSGKPVVWSPRGALQRWEGSTRRGGKYLWERVSNMLLDADSTVLHMTTAEEAARSEGRIRAARVEIVQNGVDIPSEQVVRQWRPEGTLRLLYLGRLHPIKGLENLFSALATTRDMRLTLRVCGEGEPEYVRKLKSKVNELGLSALVVFVGPVSGDAKEREFHEADVCMVPSFSENFGMVVVEALAHGVPVVAGKGTPWSELESRGAGLWVENDSAGLVRALEKLQRFDLERMGARGREWMRTDYGWDAIAARMRTIYDQLSAA